jgi:hypothetical protein
MIALPQPPSCSYPHHKAMPFAPIAHTVSDSTGGIQSYG